MKHPMGKFCGILAEKKSRRRKLTPPTEPEKAAHLGTVELILQEFWVAGQIVILENMLKLWQQRRASIRAQITRERAAIKP